ncbi:TPA: HEPN domain-containing protein [Candidatus Micrarchaeota archaeon]|nr:HEPN domain-containing protein [Candidatus Micrarchaeota archaeon]
MRDRLDKCFEGTRESPPRLIQKNPNIELAEEHLDKAENNIAALEVMFQNKFFDWAIVTAYYSMYHATLAALWLIGIDARSHECAVLAFERFYAKKGRVENKYVEYLHRAKDLSEKYAETLEKVRTLRVQASYGIGEIKSVDAIFVRTQAKDFVAAIRQIIHEAKGL